MISRRLAFFTLLLTVLPGVGLAQWHGPNAPDSLSYQGRLTKPDGTPVDSSVAMTFALYEGTSKVWEQTIDSVVVSDGVFSVILGGTGPASLDNVAFNEPMEVGVKVGNNAEMTPRTPLTAAAYALGMRGIHAVWTGAPDNGAFNIIAGIPENSVAAGVKGATISGGGQRGNFGSIDPNIVSGHFGTIGGGLYNGAGTGATVGGGVFNTAGGESSTVSGGDSNNASGHHSAIPGGYSNRATKGYTLAAGQAARANHSGVFVWADSANPVNGVPFQSTDVNQFLIRASGGVGIGTNMPDAQLDVAGAIHSSGPVSSTILYKNTNKSGAPNGEGFRFRFDDALFGGSAEGLVIEKTDANANTPDGGIAFVNTGMDGVEDLAVAIRGNGMVGIGTPNPNRLLHVRGNNGVIRVDRDTTAGSTTLLLHQYEPTGGTGVKTFSLGVNATGPTSGVFEITDHGTATSGGGSLRLRINDDGSVDIPGNLSKGGGSFKIDHPLDPENKYLYHSFVESPDMKNVYDGVVVLDENGEAAVELPSYFEALNRDFRYQLTAIGAPGPNLYVSEKISDNRFSIAGGVAGMEVSWQVTGVRKDPYAEMHRIPVEADKPAGERGAYLHPEVFSGTN